MLEAKPIKFVPHCTRKNFLRDVGADPLAKVARRLMDSIHLINGNEILAADASCPVQGNVQM